MNSLAGERILLALWVGGLWAIGYVAIPVIFATLEDKALAGQVAAMIFRAGGVVALLCGGLLLLLWLLRLGFRQWQVLVAILALSAIAIVQFVIAPEIDLMRSAGETDTSAFSKLHRSASALYLMVSVAGLALLAFPPGASQPVGNQ